MGVGTPLHTDTQFERALPSLACVLQECPHVDVHKVKEKVCEEWCGRFLPDLQAERTESRDPCNLQGPRGSLLGCTGRRIKEHFMTSLSPLPHLALEEYLRLGRSPPKLL